MSKLDEVIEKLMELDEDSLKALLAIQEQQIANATSRSVSVDSLDNLERTLIAQPRGGYDRETINAGDRYLQNFNDQAYKLMCSDLFNDQDFKLKFLNASKENSNQAAALLTQALTNYLKLGDPIAVITAVAIVKIVFSGVSTIASATSTTICDIWKSKVNEPEISNPQTSTTKTTPVDKAIEA